MSKLESYYEWLSFRAYRVVRASERWVHEKVFYVDRMCH